MTTSYKNTASSLSGKVLIDGKIIPALSSKTTPVINPATMDKIGHIIECENDDVDRAIKSSHKAQKLWAAMKASERGKLVSQCGDILTKHAEELSKLMSYETGKALRTESRVELNVIADTYKFYGGLALELKGETIPFDPNMLTLTIREPHGVVGAIVPWNVPLMLMSMKVAPALVAGNTVVLKAPPESTFCVLRASELMNEILPPGVLNVITGDSIAGSLLVAHPDVNKVSFTGSVEAGRSVYQAAAKKLIPVTLELGGKSPYIICEDANLEAAATSIIEGMRFTRQGQSCSASTRIFIHEAIHDKLVDQLLALLNKMVIGDPMDEKTDIGSVISQQQFDRIKYFMDKAKSDPKLKIHYGCKLPDGNGLFAHPALITGLTNENEICQEEIFGPVAAIVKWNDFDEVIKAANDVKYGLAAGIWTRDISKALQAAHRMEAGFVQVNQYIVYRPGLPFGGFKNSGIGKEASLNAMLDNYTKEKTIIINMVQ